MKPPPFRYAAARSVDEAVSLLAENGSDAKILAGGQSLVPMLNFRFAHPALVVDINRISGLDFVTATDGGLRIGALTRHRVLETSPLLRRELPIVAEAAAQIGHLAIRNRGTLGGSLAHADPAAELPLIALLLDATIEATGPCGARSIPALSFFEGPLTTALRAGEIITAVDVPRLPHGAGHAFEEFTRRSGDFAIVAAAAAATLRGERCASVRIALGGAGGTPIRAKAAEKILQNEAPTAEAIAAAARAARDAVDPSGDLHASANFRAHLVEVLCRRVLDVAFRGAARTAS